MVIGERQHARFQIARGNSQDRLVISAKNLQTEERHGSVTFFLENYFSSLSQDIEVGRVYRHWITLFDHPDDDVYDGVIGEDDDEIPRVFLEIIVEEPKRGDMTPNKKKIVEDTAKQPVPQARQPARASVKTVPQKAIAANGNPVNRPTSGRVSGYQGPPPASVSNGTMRPKSSASTPSIAGKSQASVSEYNARKEREGHIAVIEEEIKKYNIESFKEDTLHKVLTIANNLNKSERMLAQDEKKNLRYLDRALGMQRALADDSEMVRESLHKTQRLSERARENFEIIDRENAEEQQMIEEAVIKLEQMR